MQVEYIDHMGDDLRVVNAARVSFAKWKDEFDTSDASLLRYLALHKHDSPFFHPQITMRVIAPIFVANQLKRHQVGAALNEVSRRYVDDVPVLALPTVWRSRPERKIKQGSGADLSHSANREANIIADEVEQVTLDAYHKLLALGVAPEQARTVLPVAVETMWIWTGSLAFFGRVCKNRLSKDVQFETQEVAREIDSIVKDLFPISWDLLVGDSKLWDLVVKESGEYL